MLKKIVLTMALLGNVTLKSINFFDILDRIQDNLEINCPDSLTTKIICSAMGGSLVALSLATFYREIYKNQHAWYDNFLYAGACASAHNLLFRNKPRSDYIKTFVSTLSTFFITSKKINNKSSHKEFLKIFIASALISHSTIELGEKMYQKDIKRSLLWLSIGTLGLAFYSNDTIQSFLKSNHYRMHRN